MASTIRTLMRGQLKDECLKIESQNDRPSGPDFIYINMVLSLVNVYCDVKSSSELRRFNTKLVGTN